MASGEQNALLDRTPRNLHLRTVYDNIYVDKLDEVRAWVVEQGREFHRNLRSFISAADADISVEAKAERPAGGNLWCVRLVSLRMRRSKDSV